MAMRMEPIFYIVTQSQNNSPRIACHKCGKLHYWAKSRPDPKRKGCYLCECSNCRYLRLAKQKKAKARKK